MLSGLIKIGDRLEISQIKEESGGKSYISQVENIIDKNTFIVHVPISYGQIIKLPIGEKYYFLFFTDKGMVRFEAVIVEFLKEDGFNLMKMTLQSAGEKMQRREFFRFSCLLPIKFSVISDDPENVPNKKMFEGIIKDVGGGGVRFVSNEVIEEDSKVKCLVMLNDDYFVIIGKVLHKQYFPKSVYKYQYRILFIGILPEEQEKIVHFIFSEQRKNIKKLGQ